MIDRIQLSNISLTEEGEKLGVGGAVAVADVVAGGGDTALEALL